jgi:hypothetical protein
LVGDWSGSGTVKVGIYRPSGGLFAEDYNGNLVWDQGMDRAGALGPTRKLSCGWRLDGNETHQSWRGLRQ